MTASGEQEKDPRQDENPAETTVPATDEEAVAPDEELEQPDTVPELSPEEKLRAERDLFEEKWLRVVAELDNVRKRSRREVLETRRFTQAEILRSLLDVLDNFERALQSAPDDSDTEQSDGFRAGVELIFQNFRGVLKDKGVEPMVALGEEFDPQFHEAVGQLEREDTEPGRVIEVVQQGFHFGDMVLRPARVIISS